MFANTLTAAMNWLLDSQCQSIIEARLDSSVSDLAIFLDRQLAGNEADLCIGLELHYDRVNRVDISIYCGQSVSDSVAGACPQWLHLWRSFVNNRGVASSFPHQYWLEYDYQSTEYRLAGLFQRCDGSCMDEKAMAILLADYSALARGDQALDASIQCEWLHHFFARFGLPQWIGLMEREQGLIKIIVELRPETLCKLKQFIDGNFGSLVFKRGLESSMLCAAVERWLQVAAVRMSIDYNPSSNALADRLCFELLTPRDRALSEADLCLLRQIECDLNASIECVESSASVLQRLPYFSLQPAVNLIDQELSMLAFNHAKICLNLNSLTIKDYFLVKRSILEDVVP
jgi:hypothetical protein